MRRGGNAADRIQNTYLKLMMTVHETKMTPRPNQRV